MLMHNRTTHLALFAALAGFAAPSVAHAGVCHDFDSDTTGTQSNPWFVNLGGLPPTTYMNYVATGGVGPGLTTVAAAPPNSTQALKLEGNTATVHRIDFALSGAAPTEVGFLLSANAGNVSVEAYNSSNSVVDTDSATSGGVTAIFVSSSGGISYVLIKGGDDEDYIDDVCMQ